MHTNGSFHGDLKPSNILINKKNEKIVYYLTDLSKIVKNCGESDLELSISI